MSIFDKVKKSARLDEHGQLLNRNIARSRLATRQIDELIGICRGVIADGSVVDSEAMLLANWLKANRDCHDQWPANVLLDRLALALQDGVLDLEEEQDLLNVLDGTIGGQSIGEANPSTRLPFSDPPPKVHFDTAVFVVTGKFAYGTRARVCDAIEARGGEVMDNPTRDTDFLVVGLHGSMDWLHSTHGTKIRKAVEMREKGNKIEIISEHHWYTYLTG